MCVLTNTTVANIILSLSHCVAPLITKTRGWMTCYWWTTHMPAHALPFIFHAENELTAAEHCKPPVFYYYKYFRWCALWCPYLHIVILFSWSYVLHLFKFYCNMIIWLFLCGIADLRTHWCKHWQQLIYEWLTFSMYLVRLREELGGGHDEVLHLPKSKQNKQFPTMLKRKPQKLFVKTQPD